ncbi:hypothetical protein IRJ41_011647 [Triplophysa rosa]|uniref:Secreted protein n=1 Tax=Triplophysa rosa TaxID=992332 RepID=A0A9W7TTU7_TRIRA|nr:hypothetical protein IRJ41_011647 [Triplophysa rosa]
MALAFCLTLAFYFFCLEERRSLPRDSALGSIALLQWLVRGFHSETFISPLVGVQWTCSVRHQIHGLLMKHQKLEAT